MQFVREGNMAKKRGKERKSGPAAEKKNRKVHWHEV